MRVIDFDSFTPSKKWRKKAAKATRELLALTTQDERDEYIKSHSHIWRDLRKELTDTFGNRCWFTDAEEVIAPLDIEHFRPKLKAVDELKNEYEGYWWLSFDYQNFRLAGQIPNRSYKQCYFPLLPGCTRATSSYRRWQEELPVFLDPINPTDVALVAFNEAGEVCPSVFATTEIEKKRVRITNNLLGLSAHEPLVEARRQVWQRCRHLLTKIKELKREEEQYSNLTLRTTGEKKVLMTELRRMTLDNFPMSSVARCCIQMSGETWAQRLITL